MPFSSRWGRWIILTLLVIAFLLTGCQTDPAQTMPTQSSTPRATFLPTATKTDTPAQSQPEPGESPEPVEMTQTLTTQPQPASSPTPAPTLADWRDAPITPTAFSDRVVQIYEEGQRQGRDPHAFSVVGDCQSIPFVFMGPYGRGALEPDPAESQLWKAINTFEPSFKRWSVSARGGFTAASLLNPLQADPELCKPGETPLSCEFRLNNPAYVLITLETWLDPETVDRYEVYLRAIVDFIIERGAVPILLTKADSSEISGNRHIINPVITNVAYEYQLPLVNFWRSAQFLPNYGIDPNREGFHLSQAGYNLKNTLALRALYQAWTTLEGIETEQAAAEPTPTQAAQPTPTPDLAINIPECDSGCIFFGVAKSQDGAISGGGVYAYAPDSKSLTRVLGDGFDLQDVTDDGVRLLANRENQLYEINLTEGSAKPLSETFNNLGQQSAYWNSDESEVIYLDQQNPLKTEEGQAYRFFPSALDDRVHFESGGCDSKDYCQSNGVYQRTADGEIIRLEKFAKPVFSPDGSRVAYLNPEAATSDNFYHIRYLIVEDTQTGAASRRVLYFPDVTGFMVYADVIAYRFSPDNNRLFVLYNIYSEYYEQSLRLQTYMWDLQTGILHDLGSLEGASGSLSPRMVWSPDGARVLLFLTTLTEEGEYQISIYQTDLTTGERLALYHEDFMVDSEYLYLTNLYWR